MTIDSLKQDALSSAQMAAVNSGTTAEKVAAWDGYAAQIAAKANASDVAAALAQKASLTDLPYALVTPGEWEFSGVPSFVTVLLVEYDDEGSVWKLIFGYEEEVSESIPVSAPGTSLSIEFQIRAGDWYTVTATRASLPGHLLDRAGNRVVVTGATTLTLPALTEQGKLRDFLVRLEISGSTVPTITFAAPTGETIAYETDGDEFPVPDEAGDWLYSFTEDCVAHKFAVSLKKVNEVTQGGS